MKIALAITNVFCNILLLVLMIALAIIEAVPAFLVRPFAIAFRGYYPDWVDWYLTKMLHYWYWPACSSHRTFTTSPFQSIFPFRLTPKYTPLLPCHRIENIQQTRGEADAAHQ